MRLIKISVIAGALLWIALSIFAQDGLRERMREMRQRRNQNSSSLPSNVPNTVQKSLEFDGVTRTFLVHTPPAYDGKKMLPLVLCFHGGLGSGKQMERTTGFSQLADRENFIVVYPDGINQQWNDGRGTTFSGATTANDVGFVSALIADMQKNYKIDARRIYATGVSNGGIFSHRLGVEMSDKFAAIATVVANLPVDPKTAQPIAPGAGKTKPLSVLMINGTDDTFVKWNGGRVRGSTGEVTSVAQTVLSWVKADGCRQTPQIENLPDKFPDDGTTVRRESYNGCKEGAEVVLYAIVGGGHGWHGSSSGGERAGFIRNFTGNLSREINSTEVIWEFFKKHSKQ